MHGRKELFRMRALRFLLVSTAFIFPLLYVQGFVFAGTFPRMIFLYAVVSLGLLIWLYDAFRTGKLALRRNWLLGALLGYIAVLFLSGIASGHFEIAFFSSHERMTGITTFLYALGWFFLATELFRSREWKLLFRGFLFSGVIIALISYLGVDGVDWEFFSFVEHGGSVFANTTFAGIYHFFAFFFGLLLLAKERWLGWSVSYLVALAVIVGNPDILNFKIWQGEYGLGALLGDPTLFLGAARASAISIGLGTVVVAVTFVIHRLRATVRIRAILFGVLCALLITMTLGFVGSVVAERGFGHNFLATQNDVVRPVIWQQSVEAFDNRPVLGYGPNNFYYAFQDTFNPEVAFLENTNWFDKLHNATLQPLVETGILGVLAIMSVFLALCVYGYRAYRKTGDFTIPLVIVILIMHFIQVQTAFNTSVSLILIFTLLAYISWKGTQQKEYALSLSARSVLLGAGSAVLIVLFVISAVIPAVHNRKVITAMRSGSFEERMELYQMLHSFDGYAPKMILSVTEKYVNALFDDLDSFDNPEAQEKIQTEFVAILDLYEYHMGDHGDDIRFVINHANMIHIARLFGVDRMERAGELLEQAKSISTAYPQVYWLSALHAQYMGDNEGALEEIERAIEMHEVADLPEDQIGRTANVSLSIQDFLLQNSDAGNRVYYHVREI